MKNPEPPIGVKYKRAIIANMEEKADQNASLTSARIKQIDVHRMQGELLLAKARGDVIKKRLVEKQAAFLLVSLRQKILQIPHTYARQLLGITDAKVMSDRLREMSVTILNDIKNLPQQITDPNWLEKLEEEEASASNET